MFLTKNRNVFEVDFKFRGYRVFKYLLSKNIIIDNGEYQIQYTIGLCKSKCLLFSNGIPYIIGSNGSDSINIVFYSVDYHWIQYKNPKKGFRFLHLQEDLFYFAHQTNAYTISTYDLQHYLPWSNPNLVKPSEYFYQNDHLKLSAPFDTNVLEGLFEEKVDILGSLRESERKFIDDLIRILEHDDYDYFNNSSFHKFTIHYDLADHNHSCQLLPYDKKFNFTVHGATFEFKTRNLCNEEWHEYLTPTQLLVVYRDSMKDWDYLKFEDGYVRNPAVFFKYQTSHYPYFSSAKKELVFTLICCLSHKRLGNMKYMKILNKYLLDLYILPVLCQDLPQEHVKEPPKESESIDICTIL